MLERLYYLLLEGSTGLNRLARLQKAGVQIPYSKLYYKRRNQFQRAGDFPTERLLKYYAKLRYNDWLKKASSLGQLRWHGNTEGYSKPHHKKTNDLAIHTGTREAAVDRIFGINYQDIGDEHRYAKHIDRLMSGKNTSYLKPGEAVYSGDVIKARLNPVVIKRPNKVANFTKIPDEEEPLKNRHTRRSSDELANKSLSQRRNFLELLSRYKKLTYPHRKNQAREFVRKYPGVVSYTNHSEDIGSTSHAVTHPGLLHTYKDIVRRYGDLSKSMKTGKPVKKKIRHIRRTKIVPPN